MSFGVLDAYPVRQSPKSNLGDQLPHAFVAGRAALESDESSKRDGVATKSLVSSPVGEGYCEVGAQVSRPDRRKFLHEAEVACERDV